MTKYLTDMRLGELLVKTGLVSVEQASDVVKLAANKNLHFGQMLVKSGWLKNSELTAGLAAQSAIRDKVVDKTEAARALITACKNGISFDEALRLSASQSSVPTGATTSKLGELMVESGVISADVCRTALAKSLSTGLPLGRMLVTGGHISEEVLVNVLEFQLRIRDGLLTREEAIVILSRCARQIFEEDNKACSGQHTVRLGELLVRAGILNRSDVSNVLEVSLHSGKRMGALLISYGFLNEKLLEAALNLQQMVDSAFLAVDEASLTLRYVEQSGGTIANALVELHIVTAPKTATRPDSTFGAADSQKPMPRPKSRTRRLLSTLRSPDEERLPQPMETIYKRLVSAYTRLARKHMFFENFDESVWLLERILAIKEQLYGPFHHSLATDLTRLSESLFALKQYEQARPAACRAIEILEQSQPYDGIALAAALNILGSIYFEQKLYADAEPFLSRALTLREINLVTNDPRLADTLRDYARLLCVTNRQSEASKLYFQARAIIMRNKNSAVEAPTYFEKVYVDSLK